ncbi:MAG: RecQ family ATP-dependent DNA helicase [Saccharofermentans sp.]|nr:RecQ family ATP-dependent DNA helicase [Saccharofermentans sp.]
MDKTELRKRAEAILKKAYKPDSEFYDDQYEAIESALTNKRTLVVQKTGWGKSLVYFMSAKLLKENGGGMTIVISPLLVLIDNQIDAAAKLELKCAKLNSTVTGNERQVLLEQLKNGECDVLFTTPETLFKKDVKEVLPNIKIGLFVIDECHCISEWGHQFRLDYGNLNKIISKLPSNVSVLGTTATANNRVIEDLTDIFGSDVYVSRGPLTRESLHIEVLKMDKKAERYAWIEKNINKLPGTGIIYCSTQKDCEYLSAFLTGKGIKALPYHSGLDSNEVIPETEKAFMNNEIKVLVATIKLGMGYDKKDIGFVIHFQCPDSLVTYYQQIGRAGRSENAEAYCFLLTGKEDFDIQKYFLESAFPTQEQEATVVQALDNESGLSKPALTNRINISTRALERVLMFLQDQGIVYYEEGRYYRSVKSYEYQGAYYDAVKEQKLSDLNAMKDYIDNTDTCLSKYVVNALNDDTATDCGKCANCLGHSILEGVEEPTQEDVEAVQEYLGSNYYTIDARKKWLDKDNPFDENSVISSPNEAGIALSKYNDSGYGEVVAYDKYHADAFRDALVEKAASVLTQITANEGYTIITNIPSARNTKVSDFAQRLAARLGWIYSELLDVTSVTTQQKKMENSYHQYKNASQKIKFKDGATVPENANIILVDDLVDSGWTLTVAGALLKKNGAGKVMPFCLADSSNKQ